MQDSYRTPSGTSRYEGEPVKRSRFVASVAPASTPDAATAFVEAVRAELAGARHTCWAWRVRHCHDGADREPRTRSSDDGEPAGSAGRPILDQIEGHEVTDAVVAVTRWFGGIKLGVGGLMRAYGGAAGRALDRAELRTVVVTRNLSIEFPYGCSGAVQGLLARYGLEPLDANYGADVRMRLAVPIRRLEAFERELIDCSSGRARTAREEE